MDALAQLSMVDPSEYEQATGSLFAASEASVDIGSVMELLPDSVSLQTYGTASTSLPVLVGAGAGGSSVVDPGETFVLLDRTGNYVATVQVCVFCLVRVLRAVSGESRTFLSAYISSAWRKFMPAWPTELPA